MNRSVLMIMGGALVVAILVAMIVQAKLAPKSGTSTQGSGVEILVAKRKLMQGESLKQEDVSWQSWPEASVYVGAIKKSEETADKQLDVYGKPVRRTIESGEPVTRQAMIADVSKGGNNFLAASLSPGMRAVAVSVKADTSVGGFLSPGDRVDVILSYAPNMQGDVQQYASDVIMRSASQTILSNVKILAVDQSSKDEEREAKIAKTATLEVTKQGAEILAMAQAMGEITLSLRRLGEEDSAQDKAAHLTTDLYMSDVLKEIRQRIIKEKTASNTIRIYSGTSVQNLPVRASGE